MRILVLVLALLSSTRAQDKCNPRVYDYDSVVCVCDASYCDNPGIITFPEKGKFTLVTSTKDGLRFNVEEFPVSNEEDPDAVVVTINPEDEYQIILGFGGAFTDSTGLNVVSLPEDAQEHFYNSYFTSEGIGYTIGRIPIAGADCSTRTYSYDDVAGDVDLQHFNLTFEDYDYKIPVIKRAKELSPELKLFGSPWSPPAWMKTNGMFNQSGTLIKEYWQPWANYIVKFLDAYEAEGVELWGLTPQNEPMGGFQADWHINVCGWTSLDMRDWIKNNLGPTLQAAGYRRLKMMVDDFNRDTLTWYVEPMLEDPDSAQYIDGIAIHWYEDKYVGPHILDKTQALAPDKFLLYSEACFEKGVKLGSWDRGMEYLHFMMEALNHHCVGWVDWNLALDTEGGPNWASNWLDAPIIINPEAGEFYKEPIFYAIGHLSKFVEPGAVRISSTTTDYMLDVAAFNDPSGRKVVVLLNRGDAEIKVSLTDGSDIFVNFGMEAGAIQTILY
ncbi:lysosomal acid glucosylceramidase-like [Homarus americanus]|uniref:Glucosylceramidase n=1 Tax=Homarus americanus TaxID=6706 RepID=A0A8J5JIA3_HOMAM|nr:lysosomal acid glucosylceramidase-like [Homarus americanus]KAG7153639.1 Lysosomal acid glucosylceramidase-like 2 [Homarus americanus]